MKKVLLFAFGATLLLASCKKDYTCTCENKYTIYGTVYTDEYSYSVEGANKTQAQAACNEATIKQTDGDGDYDQYKCTLKK